MSFLKAVCLHRFSVILFTNILWDSISLKLINKIDDAVVYNTPGAHAAEVRGMTCRRTLGSLANPNTLVQLANWRPLRERLHKTRKSSECSWEKGQSGVE